MHLVGFIVIIIFIFILYLLYYIILYYIILYYIILYYIILYYIIFILFIIFVFIIFYYRCGRMVCQFLAMKINWNTLWFSQYQNVESDRLQGGVNYNSFGRMSSAIRNTTTTFFQSN